MIVITTHDNTDFDGLASAVAAQKLYPGSAIVLPGKVNFMVKEFLSLYKSSFSISKLQQIDKEKVKRMIIVDTQNRNRIGKVAELLDNGVPVTVFDHHDTDGINPQADEIYCEKVGAAVTLLIERIIELRLRISSVEATVMALGIYDDTGNLLYPTTTARDMRAAAFLLDNGANMSVIAEFLGRPLSEPQRLLQRQFLKNSEIIQVNGLSVMITNAVTSDYVGGIPIILKKITSLENVDIIFALAQMGNRMHLVARSFDKDSDILNVIEHFGGKGHPLAAAAVIKNADFQQQFEELKRIIPQKMKNNQLSSSQITSDVMTSPVKTVNESMPVRDVRKTMMRYGHSGLPVVDDNYCLVGIISSRDIEKAVKHDLAHAPVKGFMSKDVITVPPDLPLHEVQQIMIEKEIGRIPVVYDGKLMGIISRSDIVGLFHGGEVKTRTRQLFKIPENTIEEQINVLESDSISSEYRQVFSVIGDLANSNGMKIYLVGGIVRDLLLNTPNDDIDMVVEGDAEKLAELVSEKMHGHLLRHERFKTAKISLPSGLSIDIVTARMEYYQFPAALPEVETSSLKQDLYRRDYTINAMAISLNNDSFGRVIDYYGGQMDLHSGKIRILHDKSFIEDPTRILRAIRFEKRYDFYLEDQTEALLREALARNMLEELSSGRVRHELLLIMKESKAANIIERLNYFGIWQRLLPEIPFDDQAKQLLLMVQLKRLEFKDYNLPLDHEWLYLLIPLSSCCSGENLQRLIKRDYFTRYEKIALQDSWANWTYTVRRLSVNSNIILNSEVYQLLQALPLEALPFIAVVAETMGRREIVRNRIRWYINEGRNIKLAIDGGDLIAAGLTPGREFRLILREIMEAHLNGQVNSREEELELLHEIISHKKGFYNI